MSVSTVASANAVEFDRHENYRIYRQPFPFERANRFFDHLRWRSGSPPPRSRVRCDPLRQHQAVGYAKCLTNCRLGIPYLLYVNGGDLLRERKV